PAVSYSGSSEIIEMDRMRKLIADHMVMSKHTSPHVTSFVEADVTNMVKWRDKIKWDFEKREKEKITFTPLFIEAVCKAIKDFPIINQAQVTILALGAIRKKPAVIETPEGDTIGIRHMMFLSLSYDHRVVDGSLGESFLRRVADYLEKFDSARQH